jgi:L-amino acid N-acyltransferase YncA
MSSAIAKQVPSAPVHTGVSRAPGSQVVIRDAEPTDMDDVQRIYAYHVLQSTATFEETPPDVIEMQSRLAHVKSQGTPWLVAEMDNEIVGYCYAALYRPRVAYRFTLEDSIYLAEGQGGKGLGKALLGALIERCEQGPWRQMIAVIAGTNNVGSIALHRSHGFTHAGTQVATGYKFKQWIDVVFMQRALGEGSTTPPWG